MTQPASDPRVFFASERTLLAWLRTGLAIIAVGFMVSRFGLFVHMLALTSPLAAQPGAPSAPSTWSSGLGFAFVLLGSGSIAVAAIQHGRFIATLPAHDLPAAYSRHVAVWLSLGVSVLGLGLSAYLWAT